MLSQSLFTSVSTRYSLFTRSLLCISILLFIGCSSQPDPEITTLDDQEAAQEAESIRSEVSAELADGLELSLWASEKLLADPIGMDIDNKGRVYINVTNRSTSSEFDIRGHRDWMIEAISWKTVQDRKDFLHRELAPERSAQNEWLTDHNGDDSHDWRDLTVEQEEIYTIEDRSGDGVADRSQLYIRDFNEEITDVAGSVLAFDDDVYIAVAPDMWRTTDTDGDGISDTKTSISNGYMVHIGFSGHGMSGATVAPDGRIYWGIGDIGSNIIGPDGKTWENPNQGAIFRSDPDGSNFEVFARGVRNTHEFVFDKHGNLISVDNDGDHAGEHERLVYLVSGSDSGWRTNWQFGKYVDPKNNEYKVWMDEDYYKPRWEDQAAHLLPPVAPYHSGPAGMAYNPGTALSEEWDDTFFISEFTGSPARSAIHGFTLEPNGAGFDLKSDQPVVEGILTTGMEFGPDGSLYFADWIEGWDTKDKGRIWKLDVASESRTDIREETQQLLGEEFGTRSEDVLKDLLHHQDMRVRMKAQFELARRNDTVTLLNAISQTDHQLARLHGIWGIGQLARNDVEHAESLVQYLEDTDPEIRAQAAKVLGDVRYKAAADAIIPLLKDESLRVQFFAAEALGRMEYQPAVEPIISMLEANNDEDVYLRHGGAIALERIGDVDALAGLADHPSEAVRIAAVVALRRLEDPSVAQFLDDESEYVVTNAARAINDDTQITEAVPALAQLLNETEFTNEPLIRRVINANLYNGTAEDALRLASFATRDGISETLRSEAIATLSVWPESSTLDRVTGRYRGEVENNREDATEALASIIDPVLNDGGETLRVAIAEAISSLNYNPAMPQLFGLVQDDPSPEVKIAALNALDSLNYESMDEAVAVALEGDQQSVRMTALGLIPSLGIEEQRKVELLSSVLGNGSYVEQQSALTALGEMQSEAANNVLSNQLTELINGEVPSEVQLELVQAADNSSSEELQSQLQKYRSQKPEDDMVAQYKEALYGGNGQQGAQVFYGHDAAQCTRCHAIGGRGGDVGPELGNIGNTLSREQLLLSMVEPGERIAPGYGSISVTLENGDTAQGVLKEETDSYVVLQSSDGETQQISKDQITERSNSPSAMFPMADILSKGEIRDLVEFLSQLQGEQDS
ncbi:HEAT repeat domain-containing protein [Aliifodinibius sp. S!AR15-10]|uniref:HEAT repeat domain-containing protein n=1 Tax=Aliifodinibius sp. S!AR15-10 TaxID=2950437 RepID=UPI00285EFD6A|nr:HEAT repeat domain-containing protein [Aliifodinibius sp. S!AR15-10]MDR8392510.1 HEAT repeat domain-containing protein [Aliifodinibius sp. S!AR15-10]